jgi:hypothetical protein
MNGNLFLKKEGIMTETNDQTVPETPETTSLKDRVFTRKNAKRAAIIGGAAAGVLWLKKRLNASGSVSADVHVESDDSTDN